MLRYCANILKNCGYNTNQHPTILHYAHIVYKGLGVSGDYLLELFEMETWRFYCEEGHAFLTDPY
jgi:hypothetical protein